MSELREIADIIRARLDADSRAVVGTSWREARYLPGLYYRPGWAVEPSLAYQTPQARFKWGQTWFGELVPMIASVSWEATTRRTYPLNQWTYGDD